MNDDFKISTVFGMIAHKNTLLAMKKDIVDLFKNNDMVAMKVLGVNCLGHLWVPEIRQCKYIPIRHIAVIGDELYISFDSLFDAQWVDLSHQKDALLNNGSWRKVEQGELSDIKNIAEYLTTIEIKL